MTLSTLEQIEDTEGTPAAALAGALKESSLHRGRRIGIVLTGRSVDAPVFARVLAGEFLGQ